MLTSYTFAGSLLLKSPNKIVNTNKIVVKTIYIIWLTNTLLHEFIYSQLTLYQACSHNLSILS